MSADSPAAAKSAVIESALDVLQLLDLLAQDFLPRSLKQLVAECEADGHAWSQSKIYGMLATLEEAGWVTKRDGLYMLTAKLAHISYSWTQYITARAANLIAEVAAVQSPNYQTFGNLPPAEFSRADSAQEAPAPTIPAERTPSV